MQIKSLPLLEVDVSKFDQKKSCFSWSQVKNLKNISLFSCSNESNNETSFQFKNCCKQKEVFKIFS